MSKDTAAIRDQLGNDPDVTFFLNADYSESVGIEEQSTIISTRDITNTWVVGSATNGIVGAHIASGGRQLVVGKDDRDIVVIRVVNPNNTFREHFRDTVFLDGDLNNTADWNTTLFRLVMTTASSKKRGGVTIATSKRIWFDAKIATRAVFNADETLWGNDDVKYYLSADDGNEGSWEEVQLGVEHIFSTQGNKLKFRVIFSGNGGVQTWIENIRISYTTT